jgi:methylase of polypeptide subunit release factors
MSQNEMLSYNSDWVDLVENNSFFQPKNLSLENLEIFDADKIKVFYTLDLNGGGTSFGQRYSYVLSKLYPNRTFENCFEWCSGPGFIGFSLLSRKICNNLYLNDIYLPAIESIQKTIEKNPDLCKDHVFYQHTQSMSDLPDDWKFDLVIASPPHWNPNLDQFVTKFQFRDRICCDLDWKIHSDFFSNIKKHLRPDGIILLQENSYASGPEMFRSVIEQNGLVINDAYSESKENNFYYLEILHKQ